MPRTSIVMYEKFKITGSTGDDRSDSVTGGIHNTRSELYNY